MIGDIVLGTAAGEVPILDGSGKLPSAVVPTPVANANGLQSMQVFTSSGTWTKPAGISKVKVTVVGGGGGGGGGKNAGATGGSGVVIIRSNLPATSTSGSPTVTTTGSDTVYRFTGSGTIVFPS